MQRLGNVEGWRLDTIQDFFIQAGLETSNESIGNKHCFFIVSIGQIYQNYQPPPKRSQNSDLQSHFWHQKSG